MADSGFDYISILPTEIHPKANFGVRVSGNSMEPRYYDGDIVQVECCPAIMSGEIGIFSYKGEGYIKQLIVDTERREIILRSLNKDYDDIIVRPGEELHTYGRVVGTMSVNK